MSDYDEDEASVFEDTQDSTNSSLGSDDSNEGDEEEENDFFRDRIREAVELARQEPLNIGSSDTKRVREALAKVLTNLFTTVNTWQDSKHLQHINDEMGKYQEKEETEEILPAVKYALRKRKIPVDEVIHEVLQEITGEDTEDETQSQ